MTRLPIPGKDSGTWGDILNDYLSQSHKTDGSLKDNSVGSAQLQDNSVGSAQLKNNSVGASQLQDNAVGPSQLATNAVTASAIADSTITSSQLATDITDKLDKANTALQPSDASTSATGDSLAKRTSSGTLVVAPATASGEAVTLGQALAAAVLNPAVMTDGAVSALAIGTFIGSYGNTPAFVQSGRITHSPTPGTNRAAYIESCLPSNVCRIGMVVDWPAGSTQTFALVVPSASWMGSIGTAGVHVTVTAAGRLGASRYSSGTQGLHTTDLGSLTGRHTIEVGLDSINQIVTVWVDSLLRLTYTDATAFTMISDRAIWELYEYDTSVAGPAAFIVAAWADVYKPVPPSPFSIVATAQPKAYAQTFLPSSYTTYSLGTTYQGVVTIGTLTVAYPPSGRLLANFRCYLESCTGAVYGSIGNGGDQQLAPSGYVGPIQCEMPITGTPGASATLSPKIWVASGTGMIAAGGARGLALMSAIPIESV